MNKKKITIKENTLKSLIAEALEKTAKNSISLNRMEEINEMARINLKEQQIFPFNSFAIWVYSNDHNPPHFHVISKADKWDLCFLI